jgi:cytochrome c peroxidase
VEAAYERWSARGAPAGDPELFHRIDRGLVRSSIGDLVAKGEALFFEETFDGNGRTCGSCHRATNNFTIDPEFIATLPPADPLFVAETNPDLAENFENPVLMREFGLIVENVDGFDDLENKFTMRGVPHVFAQALSIAPSDFDSSGGGEVPPFHRTGWSGDGAPGNGTLREFALGAVRQHFTRTLAREIGVDFRPPTDPELDALEAFQLSLGRQEELDLFSLALGDPEVKAGRDLFIGAGKCFSCHSHGGANADFVDPSGTLNVNFDTGVEDIEHPADATGEPRPRDGGFGVEPHPLGGFGDGRFNTPSIVEAADTPPFFHHNVFATIEETVEFYASDAFNDSPSGTIVDGITLTDPEIRRIALFLRAINALENIRSAIDLQERAKPVRDVGRLLVVALSDIEDAIGVLGEKGLHTTAVLHLTLARGFTELASESEDVAERNALIDESLAELAKARKWVQFRGSVVADDRGQSAKQVRESVLSVTPNPGSGPRTLSFPVDRTSHVVVEVFDVRGRLVATPFAGTLNAGSHTITWDGRSRAGTPVRPGLYFSRVRGAAGTDAVRFVVLDR